MINLNVNFYYEVLEKYVFDIKKILKISYYVILIFGFDLVI